MKNVKKTLVYSSIISSLICSGALAKEGHSVSIEASRIDFDQSYGNANYLGSNDKVLPTIGYGYNFEFDKFFIKPALYYNIGSIEAQDTDNNQFIQGKSTFTPTFSIEGDFGYNVTNKFGIFGTVGLMHANLERELNILGVSDKEDANSIGYLFGVGLKYDIIDQLSLTAKYQFSQLSYGVKNSSQDYEIDVNNIRIGLAYNF